MARKQASRADPAPSASKGSGGKVANDVNKMGSQKPMQKNEGMRTPQSRGDRDTQLGSDNQSQARKGMGTAKGKKGR